MVRHQGVVRFATLLGALIDIKYFSIQFLKIIEKRPRGEPLQIVKVTGKIKCADCT